MGTQVIAKDVNAEAGAIKAAPPVRRGLELLHYLNSNLLKAQRNYAPGKADAVPVGLPAVNPNSTRFKSGTNYLMSSLSEPLAATIFIVAMSPDDNAAAATRPAYFGTFQSPKISDPLVNSYGIGMYSIGATVRTGAGITADAVDSSTEVATGVSAFQTWALHVVRIRANGKTSARNVTLGGDWAEGAFTRTGPRIRTSGKIMIGSMPTSAGQQGQSDQAMFVMHSVELTADEEAAQIAWIKAYMATRSIVV